MGFELVVGWTPEDPAPIALCDNPDCADPIMPASGWAIASLGSPDPARPGPSPAIRTYPACGDACLAALRARVGGAWCAPPASGQLDGPEPAPADDPVGHIQTWWRGDPLPVLPPVLGLAIAPTDDARLVAGLAGCDARAILERLGQGHRPWLARLAGEPVGYGWIAASEAAIGELGLTLALPPANRYLWDFVTSPPWRGRGIYPRLLQTILAHEGEAERFWVGHDHTNVASARGIARAGFQMVGALYRVADGGFALVPAGPLPRATAAAALLDVPLAGRLSARTA